MTNKNEIKNKPENENLAQNNNDKNSISETYAIATKVSNIGFEMIFFVLFGVLLDHLFGTVAVFAVIFALGGAAIAFWHLIKISDNLH
ncbi:MAG: AtpZ/AtpI family protein [Planctomycetaceae bacterium]|jgi:F0F1-type ATP synthase assembly protein I|nr:AtpZ/AtpI family protein [Planctomycetaceae bacterium]